MKRTFSQLVQTTQDICIDDSSNSTTGLSDHESFIKLQVNNAIKETHRLLNNYTTRPVPKYASTVEDQIFYHNPPGLRNIVSATLEVGDIDYPLEIVNSQKIWDKLQAVDVAASTIPQYIFPRQSDFGIYPTPDDTYTLTLVGNYTPITFTANDTSDGTVTINQNSQTVEGSSTSFTQSMVNRWFVITSDGEPAGNWYKISSVTDNDTLTLQSYFEETSVSGENYLIGESPDLPEELFEFIPYKAAASYYATLRRDPSQAQALNNFYYTGDYNNARRRGKIHSGVLGIMMDYKTRGRGNSQITRFHKSSYDAWHPFKEAWGTTLSES
jgi:hypothetical protein